MDKIISRGVILAIVGFLVLWGRMAYLQVIASDEIQEKVVEQRVKTIKEIPERGKIVDRNGKILAMSMMAKNIAVYPNLITSEKHQVKVAELLHSNLGVDYDEVLNKVKKDTQWESVAKRIDADVAMKIKDSGVGGIEISQSPKRYYPNGDLGASLLGFVNHDNQPGAGLELSMNEDLAGIPGYTLAETDNKGNKIATGFTNISSAFDGKKVTLAIDSYMQYVVEKRLKQAMEEMEPKGIHAIVMNPNNGDVYAMASAPSFDPSDYTAYEPHKWNYQASSYTYEPGSTIKPIIMAAAMNEGAIDENFLSDTGSTKVSGVRLRDWNGGKGWGKLDLEGIIKNSSNVGMINISRKMSDKQLVETLSKAGFGEKTGINMPAEERGLFVSEDVLKKDPVRKATVSFGQGLSVTPIQLITAFSEVINGGYSISPQLVKEIVDKNGNETLIDRPNEGQRIYKDKVVAQVKSYLEVNMREGSGANSQIEGYKTGGKTGSAWKVDSSTGGYKKGAIIGSFLGFAPYENPEISVLIVVDEPKEIEFGSEASGPLFKDIVTEIMRYKNVGKETEGDQEGQEEGEVLLPSEVKLPSTNYMLFEDAKKTLESTGLRMIVKKQGVGDIVVDQDYKVKNDIVIVDLITKKVLDDPYKYIPSLYGKSKEEVMRIVNDEEMDLTFFGEGEVVEQSIEPGKYSTLNKMVIWLKEDD